MLMLQAVPLSPVTSPRPGSTFSAGVTMGTKHWIETGASYYSVIGTNLATPNDEGSQGLDPRSDEGI